MFPTDCRCNVRRCSDISDWKCTSWRKNKPNNVNTEITGRLVISKYLDKPWLVEGEADGQRQVQDNEPQAPNCHMQDHFRQRRSLRDGVDAHHVLQLYLILVSNMTVPRRVRWQSFILWCWHFCMSCSWCAVAIIVFGDEIELDPGDDLMLLAKHTFLEHYTNDFFHACKLSHMVVLVGITNVEGNGGKFYKSDKLRSCRHARMTTSNFVTILLPSVDSVPADVDISFRAVLSLSYKKVVAAFGFGSGENYGTIISSW